jgi:hypothetical protein
MPGEKNALLTKLVGNGDYVRNELRERIRAHAGGFAALVVPALIGNDNAETGRSQRFDLFVPPIPKFREAMKKKDDGAGFGAGGDGIQGDVAILKSDGFQEDFPRGESLLAAANRPLGKNTPTQC